MKDEEATRLMVAPFAVVQHSHKSDDVGRREQSPGQQREWAETPCVGIASMGNTHFGDTCFGPPPGPTQPKQREERSSTRPSVHARHARNVTASAVRLLEVSRSLSLFLGLCVGVGAALLILLVGRAEKTAQPAARAATRAPVSLRVSVKESGAADDQGAAGIASVAVRAGNQVVVTEEDGVAEFSNLPRDDSLVVEASCPEGYVGGRLLRTFTPTVLSSSPSWSLELGCEPEYVQVEIIVKATGCGDMNVFIDGVSVGTTQNGELRTSSRTFGEAAITLRVEPVSGACQMTQTRPVALIRSEPVVEVNFEGARPPTRRIQRNIPNAAPRPYRL
jgi:hypothetical protein